MPIEVFSEIRIFDQPEFHALDHRIMPVVFEIHNEFGRFLDEAVYKRAIAARVAKASLASVEREVRIRVTHEGFAKDYFMDLLFDHALMLEAKAASAISPAHRNQSLNYLFLSGMQHGRLVNMRSEKVQHEFVSTHLTPQLRRQFALVDKGWHEINSESKWLKEMIAALLVDWGAFLDIALYQEAITYFLGGPEKVYLPVEIFADSSQSIGFQKSHLLTDDMAFAFSAVGRSRERMKEHQLRFLRHTRLRYIQWVNFNRDQIEFTTLRRDEV